MITGNEPMNPDPRRAVENHEEWWGLPTGISQRTWLAGMAMQGLLANEKGFDLDYEKLSEYAVKHADKLIDELNK